MLPTLGGREETQSWTRRLTLGFERRLTVFFEDGLEVIMMVGPGGRPGDWECEVEGVSPLIVAVVEVEVGGRALAGR